MKLKIYAIIDYKVGAFMRPFFAQSNGEALRIWEDSVNDQKSGFFKHPSDYCLYELGAFDPIGGRIDTLETPNVLGTAAEFVKPTAHEQASVFQPQ